MNFKHYLPNTEERIERLRKIINGRTVAIILQGSSALDLEERREDLLGLDICYSSLNHLKVVEDHILSPIGLELSVIFHAADPIGYINEIAPILDRDNTIFIAEARSFAEINIAEFHVKYDKQILFFKSVSPQDVLAPRIPSEEHPLHFIMQSSFSTLLPLIIIGKASRIVVFGADGGQKCRGTTYYHNCGRADGGNSDAGIFNSSMKKLLENTYKTWGIEPIEIINCSTGSAYSVLEKRSYNDTFKWLKEAI